MNDLARDTVAEGSTVPLMARVDHGRWLADCLRCPGAELVAEGRPFVCESCGFTSEMPPRFPRARSKIEALLLNRPYAQNRNWSPGETVVDLERENAENGVEEVRHRLDGS